jgi:hypothetical protein
MHFKVPPLLKTMLDVIEDFRDFNIQKVKKTCLTSNMPRAFQSYKPTAFKVYGAICVNNTGKILLVRGRQSKKWSFPKGHMERGESAETCARRELWEETGLMVDSSYTSFHKLFGGGYFIFPVEGEPLVEPRDINEIEECGWWPFNMITEDSFRCNIDLNIFRTILRDNEGFRCEEYMMSKEGKSRISKMRNKIEQNLLDRQEDEPIML